MRKILLVGDESTALAKLRTVLKPMQDQWDMVGAAGGREALAALAEHPCDVIMTDMRMPGMDGAQLLSEVRAKHPHVVRILLSDQSDQEALLRSVNSAHQCLAKTSPPEVFQAAVTRACSVRDLLGDEALRKLVSGMQTLPSLPTLYR